MTDKLTALDATFLELEDADESAHVVSYDGKVFFGLNGDDRAAADLGVLRTGLEDSLAELREVAGLATELTA